MTPNVPIFGSNVVVALANVAVTACLGAAMRTALHPHVTHGNVAHLTVEHGHVDGRSGNDLTKEVAFALNGFRGLGT
jgi:hypothetical protein